MSIFASTVGLASSLGTSLVTRFINPKEIIVDISMAQSEYVANNLIMKNLEYAFAKRDRLIALRKSGWEIAVGRRKLFLTETYTVKLGELILICKEKSI